MNEVFKTAKNEEIYTRIELRGEGWHRGIATPVPDKAIKQNLDDLVNPWSDLTTRQHLPVQPGGRQ